MDVRPNPDAGFSKPRMHPYISYREGEAGFVDLRQQPERIEEVLEDYRPHAHQQAVRTFYDFLRWVNGPDSILESCDCALRGPEENTELDGPDLPKVLHGRIMLLYRDLARNCDEGAPTKFVERLYAELQRVDEHDPLTDCMAGLCLSNALHRDLSTSPVEADGGITAAPFDPGLGQHVGVNFWAFGRDDLDAWDRLNKFFLALWTACERTSRSLEK